MRELCEWSALRLRVLRGADCVIRELCKDAQVLQQWTERLGTRSRREELASCATRPSRRCRKKGLANARFPLWTASSQRRKASWRISPGRSCPHKGVQDRLPYVGRG